MKNRHYPFLKGGKSAIHLSVHAVPRAKESRICGVHGERLKISLAAPPVTGKANSELICFLAKLLGCAKQQLSIERGESSRDKEVSITGVGIEAVEAALDEALCND